MVYISVFLGIARGLLQITFPTFMATAITKMSDCVSPLSMIIIATIIADVDIKTLFEMGVLLFSIIRPLICIVYNPFTIKSGLFPS